MPNQDKKSPKKIGLRLNKFISYNSGYSRKEADKLIKDGLVKVNGKVVMEDFFEVDVKNSKVFVKNKRIYQKKDFTAIVYHKGKGELVTHKDERGRTTIFHKLPSRFSRFNPVGRLDYASSGLLLLVDSPVIADFLMQSNLEREYLLKIKGKITNEVIEAMKNGLEIKNCTKGAHAKTTIKDMSFSPFLDFNISEPSGGYQKLKVLINEGKNRELRRFFGYFDLEVVELKRVAFGIIELGMLKEGKWRFFENSEYEKLREFLKENKIFY